GLAAKNAILIVEFAKERVDQGEDVIKATLEAVRLRLRPIIMTSLAFILGVMPLVLASGAGAVARRTIGFTVLGGMLAATSLAIFIVPVLFVLITKAAYGKKKLAYLQEHHDEIVEDKKKISAADVDPALEIELKKSHAENEESKRNNNPDKPENDKPAE
ncbi:MAG: efflux RND transporter permease subunit, partial [Bacteroidetes bacterium]|nr:efflux RND transporter permease subunit [Bacteroidota bacterium]